ncbi:MAG: TIGR03560 family F420-dependent LLM class oxidoreductase, partial [Actinomycetota bacterium]
MTHLGLQLPSFTFPDVPDNRLFERVAAIAKAAEDSGFDSFWVMDHYHQIANMGPRTDPMLEAYTVLSGVAARTSTIRLGAMVTGVVYRNPAFLAKVVTTLDVVSSGRAILGIGAAWNDEEARAYGYDWPSTRERFDRLEDALRICRAMFTQQETSFRGAVHRVDGALNIPQPVQPGGPKILVGGGGERKTLALTARYA